MQRAFFRRPVKALFTVIAGLLTAAAIHAETFVGATVESRVMLGFKVDDAAAQAWLPDGWKLITLPKGPVAGANLLVVFMDRHLVLDAEGKPAAAPQDRAAAMLSYAVNPDEKGPRTFITRVFETPPVVNTYSNSVAAVVSRSQSSEGTGAAGATRQESWTVAAEGGGEMRLDLNYQAGTPIWIAETTALPYSAAEPEFHRIYRYGQLVDLAMNTKIGKPLKGDIAFTSSIPDLAAMFDGSETLVSAMVVPVYLRKTSLP